MEKCVIISFRRDPDEISDYLIDSGFVRFKDDVIVSDDIINCGKTLMRAEKEIAVGYLTHLYLKNGRGGELFYPAEAGRVLISHPDTSLFLTDTCIEHHGSFYFDGLVDTGKGNRPIHSGHIIVSSEGAFDHLVDVYNKLNRGIRSACRGCVSDISDAVKYLKEPDKAKTEQEF